LHLRCCDYPAKAWYFTLQTLYKPPIDQVLFGLPYEESEYIIIHRAAAGRWVRKCCRTKNFGTAVESLNMSTEEHCPICGQPVDPKTQHCHQCGIDLAMAVLLIGKQKDEMNSISGMSPVAPEMLVPRLGEYLLEKGILDENQLRSALDFQKELARQGRPCLLGQALLELAYIDRETLDQVITEQILQLQAALQSSNRQLEQRVQERTLDLQNALSKLSELSRLKSNFISNISHELRTPLTHIKGYLDLLNDGSLGPLTSMQGDALKVLIRAEERLEKLIEDMIHFSQAASGEFTLKMDSVELPVIIQKAVQRLEKHAEGRNLSLQVQKKTSLPPVLADKEKISWVILQLIDNAIKFTPPGGSIVVDASLEQDMVTVRVLDTGVGIPEHRVDEIFEPFHQLDGSSTRRYNGAGLGLALVKNMLEAHGSLIKVRSEVGRGTQFEFSLIIANNHHA
jgi:signal transduction histidine kinase